MSTAAAIRIGILAALLVLLEVLCRTGTISPVKMLPPSTIVVGAAAILGSGHMLGQIARTFTDVAAAVVLALIARYLFGVGLGAMPRMKAAVEAILVPSYAIPIFIFYPFLVVVFGSNHYTRIAIGCLSALAAMVVDALTDFDRVPPVPLGHQRVARQSPLATGLGLVIAYAFAGVLAAELIRSSDGVGHEIALAFNNFHNREMYALVLVLLVGATAVSWVLGAWGRRLGPRRVDQLGQALENIPTRHSAIDGLVLVAALAVLWQLLSLAVPDGALPSPWRMVVTAAILLQSADFAPHLTETAVALLKGYGIAVAVGLPAGLLLGAYQWAGDVAEPMLAALDGTPKIALYPVLLVAFGIGMRAKVALGALYGVVPVALFAARAVRTLAPGGSRTASVRRLTPQVFTGLRVGFVFTLVGTLAGEVFGSERGIGYLLVQAMGVNDVRTLLPLTLLVVTFAAGVGVVLLRVDWRLHRLAR